MAIIWVGKHFTVIDTGGYVTGSDDAFEGVICSQVEEAMNEVHYHLIYGRLP